MTIFLPCADGRPNGFGWKRLPKSFMAEKHGVPASDRFDTKLLQTPHI
jgi:hypothetical protein